MDVSFGLVIVVERSNWMSDIPVKYGGGGATIERLWASVGGTVDAHAALIIPTNAAAIAASLTKCHMTSSTTKLMHGPSHNLITKPLADLWVH